MRILIGLVLFFAAFQFNEKLADARPLSEIQKSGVIKIAVDGSTPGFNYFQGKELTGFEIDLSKEIAKKLGVQVEWVVQPFNTLLVAVNQERFDLIATSFAITPERMKAVDFTSPHYCTGAIIVSKPHGPKTGKDLAGKVVVVPVGTVYLEPLKKISGIKEIRTVPSETDGLQNLLSGRADAWVTEQFVALEAIKRHSKTQINTGEVILPQKNAMVVSKGNSTLQTEVNRALQALLKDGTYQKLSLKYFGKDIRCP